MSKERRCPTSKEKRNEWEHRGFAKQARYFFHIRDPDRLIIDDEGLDMPGDAEALAEAVAGADDLIKDVIASGEDISGQVVEVTVGDGRLVGTVPIRDRIADGDC